MKLFGGIQRKNRAQYIHAQEPDEADRSAIDEDEEEYEPAQEEYEYAQEDDGYGEVERTPEELEEIECIIADYQKKKKRRRIIIFSVLAALVAGLAILYASTVRPPDIKDPVKTQRPTPTDGDEVVLPSGDLQGVGDGTEPGAVDEDGTKTRRDGVRTFLVLGLEQSFANTDTIMLGMIDTNENKVNIVSIPRDTCANVPYESKKINGVYAYSGGIDGLKSALADMTGYEVDSYIMVNIKAFVALVDTIGGVGFDIPYNMNYDDPTQNLHIHFSKGYTELSGSDAVKVVRWRQNNDGSNYGDIVRINTQQEFLKTVAKKCMSLSNLATKTKDYADIFKTYVDTDLTTGNIVWYAQQFFKMSMDDINFYTLPSNYYDSIKGFSYGTILVDDWLELLNESFNPYNEPIEESDVNIISRNSRGELYSTSGSISGGYGSFLDYDEYMRKYYGYSSGDEPTDEPTGGEPTDGPTGGEPTDEPTGGEPTDEPTDEPTGGEPADEPTGGEPTDEPTGGEPTDEPTGGETSDEPTGDEPAQTTPDTVPNAPPSNVPAPAAPGPYMQTGDGE